MTDPTKISIEVPPPDYRINPQESALWDTIGGVIDIARRAVGNDMAFSIVLSRVARELRRVAGIADAKTVFQAMADTMEEAAKNDR